MRTMENEKLRVQISDHGAELCSIYDKEADREAVWIGDPAFWNLSLIHISEPTRP